MKAAIKATLTGHQAAMAALMTLSLAATRSRVTRRALDRASVPVGKAVKQNAPLLKPDPRNMPGMVKGLLKKSIGRRARTYRGNQVSFLAVGPRAGFRVQLNPSWTKKKMAAGPPKPLYQDPIKYAHLVEGGTKPHMIGASMHPGSPAQRYTLKAWQATQARFQADVAHWLWDGFTTAVARGAKRTP